MTHCHISKQIADHVSEPAHESFDALSKDSQEIVIAEIVGYVMDGNSVTWADHNDYREASVKAAQDEIQEDCDYVERLIKSSFDGETTKQFTQDKVKASITDTTRQALNDFDRAPDGCSLSDFLLDSAA